MSVCGITSRFQLLSPCERQVIHALLTRPPLNYKESLRKDLPDSPVRLACVRHAASVHPEPGSNSHVKISFPSGNVKILIWKKFSRSKWTWLSIFILLLNWVVRKSLDRSNSFPTIHVLWISSSWSVRIMFLASWARSLKRRPLVMNNVIVHWWPQI